MSTILCQADARPSTTLTWPGKQPPETVSPAPVRLVETYEPARLHNSHFPDPPNALYHGDNLPLLAHLLATGWGGRLRLIYADPPYDSGVTWMRKVRLRGPRLPGVSPVVDQQPQYADTWREGEYLQFIFARLHLLRDLLAADGTLWLHCDHRHAHHLRCLLDEVFGARNHLNTITWRSQTARGAKVDAFYFPNSAQTLHVYARDRGAAIPWNPPKKQIVLTEALAAAEFMRDARGFFRTSDPGTYSFASLARLHAEGRLYAPYGGEVVVDAAQQRIYASNGGNLGVKYYLVDLGNGRHMVERAVDNIWDDIPGLGTTPGEDLGYPTQKTLALLERIVATATAPGDWVLDPFAGSGTALAAAQKLGRRWIGLDAAAGAVQTAVRRLHGLAGALGQPAEGAGFACFAGAANGVTQPSAAPEVHLSITPVDGSPATIRICIDHVVWPVGSVPPTIAADWRRGVESIAIDPAYDGQVLRVALADAPSKRSQLVGGTYHIPVPSGPTTVAVRAIDIWGRVGNAFSTSGAIDTFDQNLAAGE